MNCCTKETKERQTKDLKRWIFWIAIAILGIALVYVLFFNGVSGHSASTSSSMVGGC